MSDASNINPGIRRVVKLLNDAGFMTCDSGDGETHDHSCDRDEPYVVVRTRPDWLVEVSNNIARLLEKQGLGDRLEVFDIIITATYSPIDGIAAIDISGIHDRMLPADLEAEGGEPNG